MIYLDYAATSWAKLKDAHKRLKRWLQIIGTE
jgi:hypothetical protein